MAYWRTIHNVWKLAFTAESLQGYLGMMDQSARRLVVLLEARAVSPGSSPSAMKGAMGSPFRTDIHHMLGMMTMQVSAANEE